jgi:hypothetical protein
MMQFMHLRKANTTAIILLNATVGYRYTINYFYVLIGSHGTKSVKAPKPSQKLTVTINTGIQ